MSDERQRDFTEDFPEEKYPINSPLAEEQPPPAPRKKGVAWLAWLVIWAGVGVIIWGQFRAQQRTTAAAAATGENKLDYAIFDLQVRYLLGADRLLPIDSADFYEQSDALDRGTLGQRIRFVVVAGDMAGAAEARRKIATLHKQIAKYKVKPTAEQERDLEILDKLYRDYENLQFSAPSLSQKDRDFLTRSLGWIGELALTPRDPFSRYDGAVAMVGGCLSTAVLSRYAPPHPEIRAELLEPATRTFVTIFGAVIGAVLFGLLGFVGLVLFLILLFGGKLKGGISGGILHGNVYAETFALWMVLFFGLSLAGRFLTDDVSESLLIAGGGMLFSLSVLLWPVLRGIPWRQVREDIGWTAGRRPLLEPAIGIGCYAMALPLLGIGVAIMLILLFVQQTLDAPVVADNPFAPSGYPAHPIIEKLANGGFLEKLQIILLAAVIAPIVEETMFRGVLYRHLRESSSRYGFILSVILSGTVVSFIFAIIHPQGWVAVPALMSLAYGFTIAREWRGTLIPSMVGHGLNNALVTTVAILALG